VVRHLIAEARDSPARRYTPPNVLALNFVIMGLPGEGVTSSARSDPKAESLGEYLRAKAVPVPVALLEAG
jgi:hypothetical protein